jgi:catechol 2,3-dioxygenase
MRSNVLADDRSTAAGGARLARVHLFVGDLERARHFYTNTLGLQMTHEQNGACFLAAGDAPYEVGLFEHVPAGVEPPIALGCRSIAFEVRSRGALLSICDRLLGARFSVVESDGAWAIHTTDPDGNRIEVFCSGPARPRSRYSRARSLAELQAAREPEVA